MGKSWRNDSDHNHYDRRSNNRKRFSKFRSTDPDKSQDSNDMNFDYEEDYVSDKDSRYSRKY